MMDNILEYFDVFLLVFARMGGMVFISPVFSRRGVPAMVRIGLALALSVLLLPAAESAQAMVLGYSGFEMGEALIREVILGLLISCIVQLFFYMLYVAGDLLDTVFGLSMSKVMDPGSGMQNAVLGQFINVYFFLYFFATGGHLLMVKLFSYTYEVVPVGAASVVTGRILWYVISLFGGVFLLVIKLTLPFVAAEFVLEVTMGVLMKLIPQIHVFVINIQSKMILGMMLMLVFAYTMGGFMDSYIHRMMEEVQKLVMMFG